MIGWNYIKKDDVAIKQIYFESINCNEQLKAPTLTFDVRNRIIWSVSIFWCTEVKYFYLNFFFPSRTRGLVIYPVMVPKSVYIHIVKKYREKKVFVKLLKISFKNKNGIYKNTRAVTRIQTVLITIKEWMRKRRDNWPHPHRRTISFIYIDIDEW